MGGGAPKDLGDVGVVGDGDRLELLVEGRRLHCARARRVAPLRPVRARGFARRGL